MLDALLVFKVLKSGISMFCNLFPADIVVIGFYIAQTSRFLEILSIGSVGSPRLGGTSLRQLLFDLFEKAKKHVFVC